MDELNTQAPQEAEIPQTTQTQQQPLSLVVDDRKISVPVVNRSGEQIGVFYFDPLDIGMVKRYNEVIDKFNSALSNLDTDGGMDALNKAGDKIIEFLDYVTGGNSREAFFSKIHPLSPQNGRFYCEQVFEVIGAFIRQSFEAEGAMIDKRVSDHTHGYRTGKHAKGDR